jgi:Tfp pilus assembly protein PilN
LKPIKANIATVEYIDKRIVYSVFIILVVIGLIIFFRNIHTGFRYHADILNYKEKITRLQQKLEARKRRNEEIKSSLGNNGLKKIEKDVAFVNRLIILDIFPWDKLLDALENSVPEGMTLNSVVPLDDFKKINIDGYAGAMRNITQLLKMLEKSTIFHKSSLVKLSVDESNVENIPGEKAPDIHFEIETFLKMENLLPKTTMRLG